jgi:hypothetical protein
MPTWKAFDGLRVVDDRRQPVEIVASTARRQATVQLAAHDLAAGIAQRADAPSARFLFYLRG